MNIVSRTPSFRRLLPTLLALVLVVSACQSSTDEATVTDVGGAKPSGEVPDSQPVDESAEQGNDQDRQSGSADSGGGAEDDPVGAAADAATEPQTPEPSSTGNESGVGGSLLAEALAFSTDASSFGFEGSLVISGAENSDLGSGAISFSGAHDSEANATDITVDLTSLGEFMAEEGGGDDLAFLELFFADPIQVIIIEDTAWVNWDLFSMFVPADAAQGDFWIEMAAEDGGSMLDDLGVESGLGDPMDLLDTLKESAGQIEDLGADVVRGDAVTHYRMQVNLEDIEAALPDDQTAEFEGDIEAVVPLDFWVDADNRLRKVSMSITDPDVIDDAEINGITVDFEMFDYGQAAGIEPPPADQVLTEDDLGFSLSDDF